MALERFQAPAAGAALYRSANLDKNEALELANVLVDRPGKLSVRGPFGDAGELLAAADAETPSGVWKLGDKVMVSYRTADDKLLASPGSALSTVAGGPALDSPSARVGEYAYGMSDAGNVLQWGGTGAPTSMTNGPKSSGVVAVAAHLERLFVADATVPGTSTPVVGNAVFYSDLGGPVTDAATSWKDDTSGLVNQIDVGSSEAIWAMASMARQLLVFKKNAIHTLLGDTPSNFVARKVADSVGCVTPESVLVVDDHCFFMSNYDELMVYDGTSLTPLGRPAGLVPAAASQSFDWTICKLPNNHLLVTDGVTIWTFYIPTRAWVLVSAPTTVLAAPGSPGGRFWATANENGFPYLIDTTHIRPAYQLTDIRPTSAAGTVTARGRDPLAADPTSYALIEAKWTSRLARLALPLTKSVLSRLTVDHNTQCDGTGTAVPEWRVEVQDRSGTVLTSTDVAAEAINASVAYMRTTAECRGCEATEATIVVEFQCAAEPATCNAELQDVWLEYAPAQQQKPF
jgi:hypothetical protein